MPTARRTADSAPREKSVATSTFANLLRGCFSFIANSRFPTSPLAKSYDTHSVGSSSKRGPDALPGTGVPAPWPVGFALYREEKRWRDIPPGCRWDPCRGSVLLGLGFFAELAKGLLQAGLEAFGDGI